MTNDKYPDRPLTLAEVLEAAKAVVAAKGEDFVYNKDGAGVCLYVPASHPDAPSPRGHSRASGADTTGCIVGEVLAYLGRRTANVARSGGGVFKLAERGLIKGTPGALGFLYTLQRRQDVGFSWGESLAMAIEDI